MSSSILDQVLSSQKQSAISRFNPTETLQKLFEVLNEREEDIIKQRHGLSGKDKVTLEEIGKRYNVTRERIRQVENASLRRIREAYAETILREVEHIVQDILEDHGDVMTEDRLIDTLLAADAETPSHAALVRFILNHLIHDKLVAEPDSDAVYKAWSLHNGAWDPFHRIVKQLVSIIEEHGEPIKLESLVEHARRRLELEERLKEIFDVLIVNYLDITKKIEENKFGEWGLSNWSSIRPRRMNDKIYLIMKREGKPLHFTEIAKKINEAHFDNRTAYPATIHNELILDDKYVLVGRGMYALREWGYKPGIVVDVIKNILAESKKPMTRDEIVAEVLKHRIVKRSTVMLALMNRTIFKRDADGYYSLA